jgi:hypothetical protein
MYKKFKVKNHAGNNRPETVREFEGFLRDAGFTKIQATAIASVGFRAGADKRNEVEKVTKEEILDAVKNSPGLELRELAVAMKAEGQLDEVVSLKAQLAEVESDRVRMALDKEFGASGKVRSYAGKTFATMSAITPEALAEFRKDETAMALSAMEVDHLSVENRISEPNGRGQSPQTIAGVPVEKV